MAHPSHLVVGYLSKPHGIKGEMYVSPLTDHPESVFASGVVLWLGGADDDEPDYDLPPLRVDTTRPFRSGLLVRFGGVEDRSQAELLAGRYLFCPIEDLQPLAEGEVYYHQLLGMRVETVGGRPVGSVSQVYELHPADLLEVRGSNGVVMVPYRKEIVVEVDVEAGRLVIDPPPGLLELGGQN
ncbi:MAG: ribosome maturation factor RimM [Gemmatimonadetes bacterium]|nr:ribosome maturation factor RimM [Gemmatimonadota bacterium]NNF14401.1 ribosome maturation factor RimM [Gemmatimonadota bacterium]NNL30786.1 ribosome maturation factor RimM [Gemmatimonadota bacterium]